MRFWLSKVWIWWKCEHCHSLLCVQECAKRIAKVSADAKLEVDEETYLNQFKPHLMDVVYAWANGATFAQICKMTDVFEGAPFELIDIQQTWQEVKIQVLWLVSAF